ncbi:unnamed protein product [Phytophthora fragariaefolia]|uniref:Unnamed protein product n=1 Tax=Phytophthora fragariaefolia TaxID=1490495 RepID=A0A9W7D447_9STRA|nr:unnamed protein product [Phytophthora fragariaefolia]
MSRVIQWLDADAVIKLFIPDAAHSTLEQEFRVWQQLRHPNVLKFYGVCQAGPSVIFFVCEYASPGSLAAYVEGYSLYEYEKPPLMWKYLHEAVLALEYLHEREIVHGHLRCSNILVGSDGLAKLSNFGLARVTKKSSLVSDAIGSMRWQAPEISGGKAPSRESDIYSFGMCILEAESGKIPWSMDDTASTREKKMKWNENGQEIISSDGNNPSTYHNFFGRYFPSFVLRSRELVWQMCRKDPHKRPNLPSIVYMLERLSVQESLDSSQPELEPASSFDDYLSGVMTHMWQKLQRCISESDNDQFRQLFERLKRIDHRLQESEQSESLLRQVYSLLTDAYRAVKMTPEETRLLRLTSTRITTTSLYSFRWRVDTLLASLGESVSEERETSLRQQHRDEADAFVAGITDIYFSAPTEVNIGGRKDRVSEKPES